MSLLRVGSQASHAVDRWRVTKAISARRRGPGGALQAGVRLMACGCPALAGALWL